MHEEDDSTWPEGATAAKPAAGVREALLNGPLLTREQRGPDHGGRPVPFGPLRLEEVAEYRALTCRHYSRCLTFAMQCNWAGFHCLTCPAFTGKNDD